MSKKKVVNLDKIDTDKFDRSKRLGWFNIDKVRKSKILVVGAGAIGNETLKNLWLSGFQNISIVDMDHIVKSNLNRCLFFSDSDAEKKKTKATVIANKIKKLDKNVKITPHVCKIEDLPEKFIPSHNIVLGCLDNIAARLHINAHCYYYKIPYVDGATLGLIGKVQVVIPPKTSCLECGMNKTHKKIMNMRMSCTGREITFFEPKLAADINTTSIVSAIQVQEVLKIVHKREKQIIENMFYYDGNRNIGEVLEVPIDPKCHNHTNNR